MLTHTHTSLLSDPCTAAVHILILATTVFTHEVYIQCPKITREVMSMCAPCDCIQDAEEVPSYCIDDWQSTCFSWESMCMCVGQLSRTGTPLL